MAVKFCPSEKEVGQQFLMATFNANEKTKNAYKGIIVKEYYLRIPTIF